MFDTDEQNSKFGTGLSASASKFLDIDKWNQVQLNEY